MNKTNTVLSQMQSYISGYEFKKYVSEYDGDKGVKTFTTRNLLNLMLYVHIGAKQSLRDIVDSLKTKKNLWYHIGLKSVSRNNLSHALMKRPNEIFEKMFFNLLGKLYSERNPIADKRFKFKMPVKLIDSTTIGLCLSLFDWAKFRKTKGGIKLHVMYDAKEQIPDFMIFSEAKKHDMYLADKLPINANSIYVMDKGYYSYKFFQKINQNKAFFVIRTKTNTQYKIIKRNPKNNKKIKADWNVRINGSKKEEYSQDLRIVKYYDEEKKKTYAFLTNNFRLSAKTIADVYKSRWDIELFFKWMKQNLKIKTFIGTSENAVKIQIWTAMIVYLLIEYIRFKSRTNYSLLKTFRILKDNIMHNYNLFELLTGESPSETKHKNIDNRQMVFCF